MALFRMKGNAAALQARGMDAAASRRLSFAPAPERAAPLHGPSHLFQAVPVCLMIGREICMSSLREWAASSGGGAHKAVKVRVGAGLERR